MSNFSLIDFFPIFPDLIVVNPDIPLVHVSFFLCVVSFIYHVPLIVFPLVFCLYCFNINWIFWAKFVRKIFWRFLFLWLSRLLTKTTHICSFHSRLFRNFLSCSTFWWFLAFSKRRLLSSFSWGIFRLHFWFFFLGFFIFRRHGIENSSRSVFIFLIIRRCQVKNIESFHLIFKKSASGYFVLIMRCPPMLFERL